MSSLFVNELVAQALGVRLSAMFTCLSLAFGSTASLAGDPSFEVSYARVIRANCVRCHNSRDAKAGLDLSTREGLMRGGDAGPAIVVGMPDESLLIQRVTEGSMPPISDGDQLPAEQVQRLRLWITAGAAWSGPAIAIAATPSIVPAGHAGRPRRLRRFRAWLMRTLQRP